MPSTRARTDDRLPLLLLVRHARPLVEPGVCYGATDVEADAAATEAAAQRLAPLLAPNAQLWSSPLRRCTQLADALCALRPDVVLQSDARLVEMDFGDWEGWRWSDIPRSAIDSWTAQFWHQRFGGRESVSDLMARVGAAWQDARGQPRPVVWVTHAGVMRAASLWAAGVTEILHADQWPVEAPGHGAHVWL